MRPTLAAASGTGTTPRGSEKGLCIIAPPELIGDAGRAGPEFFFRRDCTRTGITVNSRQDKKTFAPSCASGSKRLQPFWPLFFTGHRPGTSTNSQTNKHKSKPLKTEKAHTISFELAARLLLSGSLSQRSVQKDNGKPHKKCITDYLQSSRKIRLSECFTP